MVKGLRHGLGFTHRKHFTPGIAGAHGLRSASTKHHPLALRPTSADKTSSHVPRPSFVETLASFDLVARCAPPLPDAIIADTILEGILRRFPGTTNPPSALREHRQGHYRPIQTVVVRRPELTEPMSSSNVWRGADDRRPGEERRDRARSLCDSHATDKKIGSHATLSTLPRMGAIVTFCIAAQRWMSPCCRPSWAFPP